MSNFFEEHITQDAIGRTSLKGGVIAVSSRALIAIVQIGTTIVLARLLTPDDFGLVAMVAALIGFAPALIELGTSDAATQKSQITQGVVSALFWFNMAM